MTTGATQYLLPLKYNLNADVVLSIDVKKRKEATLNSAVVHGRNKHLTGDCNKLTSRSTANPNPNRDYTEQRQTKNSPVRCINTNGSDFALQACSTTSKNDNSFFLLNLFTQKLPSNYVIQRCSRDTARYHVSGNELNMKDWRKIFNFLSSSSSGKKCFVQSVQLKYTADYKKIRRKWALITTQGGTFIYPWLRNKRKRKDGKNIMRSDLNLYST